MKKFQRSLMIASRAVLFSTLVSVGLGACTAKRPEVFTQGQGTDLDAISSWKDRIVPIDTGKVIGTVSSTHAQDSRTVSAKVTSMNNIDDLVQIKIADSQLASLVGNPPFRAKPDTTGVYALQIKLTDNYLKFYKVALPENIPFEEQAYAEETFADGRMAIPMLGFKITGYFHIEPVKTNDDQNSHHLTEIADTDHSKSTHVKIDWASRELFEAVMTSDLMPAELFFKKEQARAGLTEEYIPYEWYYAETVIDKSMNDSGTIVGETSVQSENSALIPASKVMFIPRENELRVVSVARDERLSRDQIKNSGDLNSEATLIIPVKWVEHRTKADGKNLSLKGESIQERRWDQRRLFEMNLPAIQSAGITEGTNRLLDVEVDQNYFSFTMLNMKGNQGRKIHYSFLRSDQGRLPYTPRQSFKSDRNLFGFFTSVKPFIPNFEYYTEQNFDRRIFMSRMNPDAKEIVFHLSAGSPAWLEDVVERTVQAWDKTFQEALKGSGREINVRFAKERVQLGDLRYNVIHLVETLSEDGLLGFGPSVADPETGEIISATTNVYVNSTQAIAVGSVRQYIIDRLEKRMGKETTGTPIAADFESKVFPISGTAARVQQAASTAFAKGKLPESLGKYTAADARKELMALSKQRCAFGAQVMMGSNDQDIQKFCPKVESLVDSYLASNLDMGSRESSKVNWEKVWNESGEAVKDCAKALTRGKLLSTLIHEVGHNLGLRHNFYGSYDKANFKAVSSIFGEKILARSSSIMEYTDWDEDRLTETGPYDIAAIRFGYGEQVEKKDGSFVKVDPTKSVDQKDLKAYLFCTDEEAYTGLNATCKPHDAGTTPSELVDFYIKGYQRSQALKKLRRVRPMSSDPEWVAASNLDRTFLPMKDIYDQWRYQLGEYVRKSSRYLSEYGTKEYAQVLAGMAKDPQFGPAYALYHDAAEKVYQFFKEVAFGENEYCLIDDRGEKRAIELERLRDMLSEATRGAVSIRSCVDAAAASELAKVLDAKAPTVISQIGYPVNSYRYESAETLADFIGSDPGSYTRERFDVVGNHESRIYAGLLIHHRMDNIRNMLNQFAPNMTDEPHHYQDFAQTILSRMILGVNLSAYGFKEPQPFFSQEEDIVTSQAKLFQVGLYTPAERLSTLNQVATGRKVGPFSVYAMSQADDPKKFAAVLTLNGRQVFGAIQKEHVLAYNMINRYTEIDRMLDMVDVDAKTQSQILRMYVTNTPEPAVLPEKTLEAFVTFLQMQSQVEEALPEVAACLQKSVPMLAQVAQLLPQVAEDYQAANDQGTMEKFMAQNLVKYLGSKLGATPLLFTTDELKVLPAALTSCARDQSALVKRTNRNRKDFEAQKSLILNVLSAYAN